MEEVKRWRRRWHPIVGGVVIGMTINLAFFFAGRGIGASGALTRFVATLQSWIFPDLTTESVYFSRYFTGDSHPLNDYLVFMMIGIIAGAFVAAHIGNDLRLAVLRGPRISARARLWLALAGGILVGFAARLARGCTSGVALVGGAQLSVGAWAFMICIFIGGFGIAYFLRKQWI
jgi:uncharacterized membrane protein YedE/YeeE